MKLPDGVDTMKLYESALAKGVAINPGPQWSVNKERARSRLRLCFASPSHEEINEGVAALAEVCRREFGSAGVRRCGPGGYFTVNALVPTDLSATKISTW